MSVPATTHDRELGRTLAIQVVNHYSTSRFGAAHASLQNEKIPNQPRWLYSKEGLSTRLKTFSPNRFLEARACAFAFVCFCTSP